MPTFIARYNVYVVGPQCKQENWFGRKGQWVGNIHSHWINRKGQVSTTLVLQKLGRETSPDNYIHIFGASLSIQLYNILQFGMHVVLKFQYGYIIIYNSWVWFTGTKLYFVATVHCHGKCKHIYNIYYILYNICIVANEDSLTTFLLYMHTCRWMILSALLWSYMCHQGKVTPWRHLPPSVGPFSLEGLTLWASSSKL